jgi:hypothetical protein
MITDEDAEKAADYISTNAESAAQAHATRLYLQEYRKSLKAMLMAKRPLEPLGAQERYAYAHVDYLKHLDALREAIVDDEKCKYMMKSQEAKIDVWRSLSANQRGKI